jgi:hypothetical protein
VLGTQSECLEGMGGRLCVDISLWPQRHFAPQEKGCQSQVGVELSQVQGPGQGPVASV